MDYLHREPLTVLEATAISSQIAQALRYLEHVGIVHGRLSCRNVMIESKNNGSIVLHDFGLGEEDCSFLPFQVPEITKENYSSQNCDVWAFGMTLLQIFNGGNIPFSELNNESILTNLKGQIRPGKPDDCPPCIYEIALRCLLNIPNQRPTITQLCTALDNIYISMTSLSFEFREEIFGVSDEEIETFEESPENEHPIEQCQ